MRFILLFIVFCSSAMADFLPQNSKPTYGYDFVSVYRVRDVKFKPVFVPETSTSVAFYDVTLIIRLEVEGNLCDNKASSLGVMYDRDSNSKYPTLKLLAGNKLINKNGCIQPSSIVTTIVESKLQLYKFQHGVESYKLKVHDKLIHLSEKGDQLKLSVTTQK